MAHKDLFVYWFGVVFFLFLKEHRDILQVSYQAVLNVKWLFTIQFGMKQLNTLRTLYPYDMLQSP